MVQDSQGSIYLFLWKKYKFKYFHIYDNLNCPYLDIKHWKDKFSIEICSQFPTMFHAETDLFSRKKYLPSSKRNDFVITRVATACLIRWVFFLFWLVPVLASKGTRQAQPCKNRPNVSTKLIRSCTTSFFDRRSLICTGDGEQR